MKCIHHNLPTMVEYITYHLRNKYTFAFLHFFFPDMWSWQPERWVQYGFYLLGHRTAGVAVWMGNMFQRPEFSELASHLWKYLERFWKLEVVEKTEHHMYFFFLLAVTALLSPPCPPLYCLYTSSEVFISIEPCHHDVLPRYLGKSDWNNFTLLTLLFGLWKSNPRPHTQQANALPLQV